MQQNSGRCVLDNNSDGTIVEIPHVFIQNVISYNASQLNDELIICKKKGDVTSHNEVFSI